MPDDFKSDDFEERYIHAIQRFGVNLGVFVLGTAAAIIALCSYDYILKLRREPRTESDR